MDDTQQEQVGQEEVQETETETQETEPQTEQVEEIVVPDNWEQGLKDFITGIQDQAGKRAVFDKINNYEKGYQKKFQDLADERKAYDAEKQAFDANRTLFNEYSGFDKSIDPSMRTQILAQYGNVPHYMEALHQMDIMASRQPEEFIKNFCVNNGITLESLQQYLSGQEYQRDYQDNRIARSQEDLKAQIMKEIEQKQQEQRYVDEVTRFAQAKDSDGNDLHPMLADKSFVADMEALQRAYPDRTLEQLYQMAYNLRPELRQKAIDEEAKKVAEAKDVEKAKSAIGVKARVPSSGSSPAKNWRQVASELIDDEAE